MSRLKVVDVGLVDYGEMLARQNSVFDDMVERKKLGLDIPVEFLFLVEHFPVLTLGRHAKDSNVLIPEQLLSQRGIDLYHIGRGGDVTFHGPGQLVAYPLIDLEAHHLGVKAYVDLLEEAVIRTVADFGVRGERVAGASGVWIGKGSLRERKICAVGVKCSRFITMHGLALNVNTDLSGFDLINPCGFTDKGVTSLSEELGRVCDFDEVKRCFSGHFCSLLDS